MWLVSTISLLLVTSYLCIELYKRNLLLIYFKCKNGLIFCLLFTDNSTCLAANGECVKAEKCDRNNTIDVPCCDGNVCCKKETCKYLSK